MVVDPGCAAPAGQAAACGNMTAPGLRWRRAMHGDRPASGLQGPPRGRSSRGCRPSTAAASSSKPAPPTTPTSAKHRTVTELQAGTRVTYRASGAANGRLAVTREPAAPDGRPQQGLRDLLSTLYLPAGYPASVTPDYLAYQLWTIPAHITGWISIGLTTSSLLRAVGIGAGGHRCACRALRALPRGVAAAPSSRRHAPSHE